MISLEKFKFNKEGLIPVIAQQYDSLEVLMMAWMNEESLLETIKTGKACYWSRSRQKLWRKGETSGQHQIVKEIIADCDDDTILIKLDQKGVACHTGRRSCFYKTIESDGIKINQDVIINPDELYKKD